VRSSCSEEETNEKEGVCNWGVLTLGFVAFCGKIKTRSPKGWPAEREFLKEVGRKN